MELVRKNILSIVCGVIAVLALVSLVWPISPMYAELQTTLDSRKKAAEQLVALKNSPRFLPVIELDNPKPGTLVQFPNRAIIEAGGEATKKVQDQSRLILEKAKELNKHELLLPKETEFSAFEFRDEYNKLFKPGPKSFSDILNATLPPDDNDIAAAAEELWNKEYKIKIVARGQQNNRLAVVQAFNTIRDKLPEQMRIARAANFRMYLEPDAIQPSAAIDPKLTPSPFDIWFAQQALWVQQDVAQSLANANASAKQGIIDAPIKHLLTLQVVFGPDVYVWSDQGPAATSAIPKAYNKSPTGRVSNTLYDVVQFTLGLRVDATRIPAVIEELEREKLITVRQMTVSSVNSREALRNGYVYGTAPVAEVILDCEELFLRDLQNQYMPEEVKEFLGIKTKEQ